MRAETPLQKLPLSIGVFLFPFLFKSKKVFFTYTKNDGGFCSTVRWDKKNKKVDGNWVLVPFYTIEDNLPYGHGEKSVYIISGFMRLTREEAMIINWHMGGFDARVRGGGFGLSEAYYRFPLAVIFHTCDMLATYLDETR